MTAFRLTRLTHAVDGRGSLVAAELAADVPFAVERLFVVYDVPSAETRGEHGHRTCEQFLICLRGSVRVDLDDGSERGQFVLDRPDVGLHMPAMTWGSQYGYSSDAMVLVLASRPYDPADYIHDYDEFLRLKGGAS